MHSFLPSFASTHRPLFIPEARVATQPPKVENSKLSGSCPIVTPLSANSVAIFLPTTPA